jgi:hypothetical protein
LTVRGSGICGSQMTVSRTSFLYSPSDLPSPDERHFRARIGHATSTDLRAWERGPDALGPSATPSFDDLATWTGSVVRGDDDLWYLFYTGTNKAERGLEQRTRLATSPDLFAWATGRSLLRDWDIGQAQRLTDESRYAGRVMTERSDAWFTLSFGNAGYAGASSGRSQTRWPFPSVRTGGCGWPPRRLLRNLKAFRFYDAHAYLWCRITSSDLADRSHIGTAGARARAPRTALRPV